ncbi:DGQHR domain-containing protein [Dyadobacter sp. CY261]|uniref:DGQHR domain-containing protein n=1 Tax=Dyadobacter sp. CY261 TaxID=2907203 RepID=UPI001F171E82|nr:DGQHR domain-containing protein [Dyadobacter sp. CY261]MCF0075330.1 DGQHR domain-containing protein [Dyadobacter sp. CY261]
MAKTVRYKTLECKQNDKVFYISVLPNSVLKSVCFVARRDEDAEKGFQRTLNESRAKDIARYLDELKGTIPSALILSAQDTARFAFDSGKGEISFQTATNSFMVLDGQHRLFGLLKATKEYVIPVVIFNKLNTTQEVNLFIDINTTQKGVPTTLLLDIKNLSGTETKKEERQRQLFDRLNRESIMAGLLSPSKSKVGKITRVSFNQSTNDIFESGFFLDKDNDTIYKGVRNYLEAAEKIFKRSKSEKAKLTNATFFRALFAIFHEAVDKALREHGDLKVESFINVMEPVSRLNFDSYTGTGNATFNKVVSDMRKELNEYERRYNLLNGGDLF